MSEPTPHAPEAEESPFTPRQLRQFSEDDATAGTVIGKMLAYFFLYTVVMMAASSIATYWWIAASR